MEVIGCPCPLEMSEFLKYRFDVIIRCVKHAGVSICIACHDPPPGVAERLSVSQRVRQERTEILRRCEFPPRD